MLVLRIIHRHGDDVFVAPNANMQQGEDHELLMQKLDGYVKEWWEKEIPDEPMPNNRRDRIDDYFDILEGYEEFVFHRAQII